MKTMRLQGCDESKASEMTREVRKTDPRVMWWVSTTQVWTWKGGDAIVLMAGDLRASYCIVVLRIGKKVHVVERAASVSAAMDAFGLDSKSFKTAGPKGS